MHPESSFKWADGRHHSAGGTNPAFVTVQRVVSNKRYTRKVIIIKILLSEMPSQSLGKGKDKIRFYDLPIYSCIPRLLSIETRSCFCKAEAMHYLG